MNILLDTHTYLWFLAGDERLSLTARKAIQSTDNAKYVSVASLWEITIKYRLGKLSLETDLKTVLTDYIYENGFVLLPIEISHFLALDQLPMHHRDPFDRMLISQCTADNMACVSEDSEFLNYNIEVIW